MNNPSATTFNHQESRRHHKSKDSQINTTGKNSKNKKAVMLWLGGLVGIGVGAGLVAVSLLTPKEEPELIVFPTIPSKVETGEKIYSDLTGLELSNIEAKTAPAYCIQTPNGTDGARPQAGLNQAGVIFEAIAEAGITRFAAIYQNPSAAVIGPIRSLRIYYLEWDTPFDCTIVHAGGADNAIAALRSGGYKELDENYVYMYRGTRYERLWNNLFTTGAYLAQFSSDSGYTSSNINGFSRMTPSESERNRINLNVKERLVITEPSSSNTSELTPQVTEIRMNFGSYASYNVMYSYDMASNSYPRFYQTGEPHNIYICPDENLGEKNPESVCNLGQLSPKVVVAIVVQEKRDWDNYHEDITTIGSGDAYIFQNGVAIRGQWSKPSSTVQITFSDENGKPIMLAPGQTIIEAIPNYGSIEY